jgi:flagellar assembly protein FliH
MAALRKFTFDRVFDTPPPTLAPVPAEAETPTAAPEAVLETPPPPTFSEEDLAAAREEAYAQGREAGLKEMSESLERETRDALTGVENALRELMWSQSAIETSASENAVRIAMTAVRRLFPALAKRDPLAEVEHLVGQAMALVQGEASLNIYVNDRLLDPITAQIRNLAAAAGFENRIKIHPLASIAPGDARVEWGNGGISRDVATIEQTIENIVAGSLPDPAPASPTTPNPNAMSSSSENPKGHHG